MQPWQCSWLGVRRIPTDLTPLDLEYLFTLDERAREVIAIRRRGLHQLGVTLGYSASIVFNSR